MASFIYTSGLEGFLDGTIDWDNDTLKAVLIDSADYTPASAVHTDLTDIPAPARVATSATLTGTTVTGNVVDADDVTFTAVTGDSVEAFVVYQDTGVEATSRLICYVDNFTAVTPDGTDIIIQWDNGANKIFSL